MVRNGTILTATVHLGQVADDDADPVAENVPVNVVGEPDIEEEEAEEELLDPETQ